MTMTDAQDSTGNKTSTREYTVRPKWTVHYNIVSPEATEWIGTGWEFFNDERDAQHCYDRHNALGNCATKRPYHRNDRVHLGAVHTATGRM